ncbi:hypothetical protein ACVNIS_24715 (plasmid) [Sphaerotilaceae bacterium SBD11-9]
MKMSPACTPPVQPACTDEEKRHPRYAEYLTYRSALSCQLVTAAPFARWLEDTERDEHGFVSVFEVDKPGARLAIGWHVHVFGPRRKLLRTLGPFSEGEARQVGDDQAGRIK